MVTLSKETFNTTRKGLGGLGSVPRRCWGIDGGDGGDRGVLEAGVLRIGGTLPSTLALQCTTREERAWKKDGSYRSSSGSQMS
jgi:hypothetical protein